MGCTSMTEQMGFTQFLLLAGVAALTIVVHARLKKMGHMIWAILASFAGLGIMIYLVI